MRHIYQLLSIWATILLPITNCFAPLPAISRHSTSSTYYSHLRSSFKRPTRLIQSYCKLYDETMSKSNQLPESFPSISIVGVCGSIGSGKSFACSLMTSKLNEKPSSYVTPEITAHHIDTDSLAHGVYAPGSKAISEIGDEFGQGVIANGTVDRKALGAIVFSNGTKMAKLEKIVWPHVKDLLLQRIQDIQESTQREGDKKCYNVVVVEAAVLLDAGWDNDDLFDAIWLVKASSDTSCERLIEKRGMEKEDALKRLKAQLSRRGIGNWKEELEGGALTAVIENEGRTASDLWDKMKQCLEDPKCWKNERCPPQIGELLAYENGTD